jgi:hypothetical protein
MTSKDFFNKRLSGEPLTQDRIIEALDEYYLIKKDLENSLPMEVWENIPNYENSYQVSNMGRIKSLTRIIENKKGQIQKYKGKILSPRLSNRGYYQIALSENNKTSLFSVHRLVMLSFVGPSDLLVDHIDRNSKNNKLENLRYVSTQENSFNRGAKGYSYRNNNNKWIGTLRINGESIYLGSFNTELEVKNAYLESKLKYHIINKYINSEM